MTDSLKGKKVLVIGGAKYIGRSIVERLSAIGMEVYMGARDLIVANRVAADLQNVHVIHFDISDESSIRQAAEEIGSLNSVISTASSHHNVAIKELEHDRIVDAFEAKIIGPLLVAKHFQPRLDADGSMIFFSGVAAWKPADHSIMGITNGAVPFLVSHLAAELAPIRVNGISPGIIDSGTWDALGETTKDQLIESTAKTNLVRRAGTNDDITETVEFLLKAGFITGETLHVEGGARLT